MNNKRSNFLSLIEFIGLLIKDPQKLFLKTFFKRIELVLNVFKHQRIYIFNIVLSSYFSLTYLLETKSSHWCILFILLELALNWKYLLRFGHLFFKGKRTSILGLCTTKEAIGQPDGICAGPWEGLKIREGGAKIWRSYSVPTWLK